MCTADWISFQRHVQQLAIHICPRTSRRMSVHYYYYYCNNNNNNNNNNNLLYARYPYIYSRDKPFPRGYIVTAILSLLFMVPLFLVPALALLFFYVNTFRSMCAVPNMAVFCSSLTSWFPGMSFTYFLNIIIIIIIIVIRVTNTYLQGRV